MSTKNKKPKAPKIKDPVRVIRTCDEHMKGYGGFPWPESGPVEAPEEWNPAWGPRPSRFIGGFRTDIDCGGGLHGISGLDDNWGLLNWDIDAKALVVTTEKPTLIQVDGKVKFRFGLVEKVTSLAAAALAWHDGERPRIVVGYVGEDGIKSDTWYRVRGGKLVEARK